MRFSRFWAAPLLGLLALASCDPGDDTVVVPQPDTTNVFVVNEGNFNRANGAISLYNKTTGDVTTDLFRSVNGRALGDVVQSMAVSSDNRGYIVVNNSNKVEVVSLPGFQSAGVVQGLSSPRYFLPVSATRGYVTQWGTFSGSVRPGIKVIDLSTNTIVDSIATGPQPERLVLAGGKVYVANSGSNTLTVIDPATHRVSSTLTVGGAPNSLAVDKNGLLWVLCGGTVAYTPTYDVDYNATTPGQLLSVNASTATVVSTRSFGSNRLQPTDLHLNGAGDQLYFRAADALTYNGPVFRLGIAEATLPVLTAPFIQRSLYGLNVDPRTDYIYGGTGTFLGTDKLIRYRSTGEAIDSVAVGAGPNGFVFY